MAIPKLFRWIKWLVESIIPPMRLSVCIKEIKIGISLGENKEEKRPTQLPANRQGKGLPPVKESYNKKLELPP